MATRCCIPPDSSHGCLAAKSSSSTRRRSSAERRSRSALSKPMISSGNSTFLAIVRQSMRAGAWNTIP